MNNKRNEPTAQSRCRAEPFNSSDASTDTVPDDGELLFSAFLASRTTLEDLSDRAAALGVDVSGPLIASHLTGKASVSDRKHNAVVDAINARLGELSLPAAAARRDRSFRTVPGRHQSWPT